jgi:hypothetical protein
MKTWRRPFLFYAGVAKRCETSAGAERCDDMFWQLE